LIVREKLADEALHLFDVVAACRNVTEALCGLRDRMFSGPCSRYVAGAGRCHIPSTLRRLAFTDCDSGSYRRPCGCEAARTSSERYSRIRLVLPNGAGDD